MSNELILKDELQKHETELLKLLPKHVSLDRFIKSASMAWYNEPKLQQCTKESLIKAVFNAAEVGLDFTPIRRHAFLVPFKNKKMINGKEQYIMEATFMPGYGGLIDLAKRTSDVKSIQAHVVYENDYFEIEYGSEPKVKHSPILTGERGNITGAYAIAFLSDGTFQPEYMHMEDLEKIRKSSKQPDGMAYKNWLEEMYRKAPVRRLCKYLPSTPDLDKALEYDNELYDLDKLQEVQEAKPSKGVNDLKEKLRMETQEQDMGDSKGESGSLSVQAGEETHNSGPAPDSQKKDEPQEDPRYIALDEICKKKNIPTDVLISLTGKLGFHDISTPAGIEEFLQYAKERISAERQTEIQNQVKANKMKRPEWEKLLSDTNCGYIWELTKEQANGIMNNLGGK